MAQELQLVYNYQLELNITPTAPTPTWVPFCKGWANVAESLNEVLYQASYLCDHGWGSTEVTGGQYIVTLTGVRYIGNELQDWVFSPEVMYAFGDVRRTQLRVTKGPTQIMTWDVTLANITETGGDANQPGAITVAIHGNGPPIISGGITGGLVVVSVAGTASGDTQIYVNPALTAGNTYRYMTGTNVPTPLLDEDLSAWNSWDGSAEISALTGNEIVIAEVDAEVKAQLSGKAIVTSAP